LESTFNTIETLGGSVKQIRRLADKNDKTWSAFNPSIAYSPERGYAIAIRSSNYVILPHGELSVTQSGPIRNRVWFSELDDDLNFKDLRQINFDDCGYDMHRGVEDPKLLWRDGHWMFTAVALERNIPVARYCECYMNSAATKVDKIVLYGGIDANRPEKNWMTCSEKPKNFDYVYDGNGIVKDGKVTHKMNDNELLSSLRGNTHLLKQKDGTYLGIMHRLYGKASRMYIPSRFSYVEAYHKDYLHYLVRFNEDGQAVEISAPFKFIDHGIEFAAGIVEIGGEFIISFGRDDITSHIATIDASVFKSTMKKVNK